MRTPSLALYNSNAYGRKLKNNYTYVLFPCLPWTARRNKALGIYKKSVQCHKAYISLTSTKG